VTTLYSDVLVFGTDWTQASISRQRSDDFDAPLDAAAGALALAVGISADFVVVRAAEFASEFTLTLPAVDTSSANASVAQLEEALGIVLGATPASRVALAVVAVEPSTTGADVSVLVTAPLLAAVSTLVNVSLSDALASGSLAVALQQAAPAFAALASAGTITLPADPVLGVMLHYEVKCPAPDCNVTAAEKALLPGNLGAADSSFLEDIGAAGLGTINDVVLLNRTPSLVVVPPPPLAPPVPIVTLFSDVLVLGTNLSQASLERPQSDAVATPLDAAAAALAAVVNLDADLITVRSAEFGASFTLTLAAVNAPSANVSVSQLEAVLSYVLGATPAARVELAVTTIEPSLAGNSATDTDVSVLLTSPFLDAVAAVANVSRSAAIISGSLVGALQPSAPAFASLASATLAAQPSMGVLLHYEVECPPLECSVAAVEVALTPASLGAAGSTFLADVTAAGLGNLGNFVVLDVITALVTQPLPPVAAVPVSTLYLDVLVIGANFTQTSLARPLSDTFAAPLDAAATALADAVGLSADLVTVSSAGFAAAFTLTLPATNTAAANASGAQMEAALAIVLGATSATLVDLTVLAVTPSATGNAARDTDVSVLLTSPLLAAVTTVAKSSLSAALTSGSLVAALQPVASAFAALGSGGAVFLAGDPHLGLMLSYEIQCPPLECNVTAAEAALAPANLSAAGSMFLADFSAAGLGDFSDLILLNTSTDIVVLPDSVVTADVTVMLPGSAFTAGTAAAVLAAVQAALVADCALSVNTSAVTPAPTCAVAVFAGTVVEANLTLLIEADLLAAPASLFRSSDIATLATAVAAGASAQMGAAVNVSAVQLEFDSAAGVFSVTVAQPPTAPAASLQQLRMSLLDAPVAPWARAGMPLGVTVAAVASCTIGVTLVTTQAVQAGGDGVAAAAHLGELMNGAPLQASLSAATGAAVVVAVSVNGPPPVPPLCTALTVSSAAVSVSAASCGGGAGGAAGDAVLSLPGSPVAATVPAAALAALGIDGSVNAVLVAMSFDPHATDPSAPTAGVVSLTLLNATTLLPLNVSDLSTPVALTLPGLPLAPGETAIATFWDEVALAYNTDGVAAVPTNRPDAIPLVWDTTADVATDGLVFAWLPTGPDAQACRSFVLRCDDPDVRDSGQRVSLMPEDSLGEPSIACSANETRSLRVFFGAACDLWREGNAAGCWWDVWTQLFAGPDCVMDNTTRVSTTHLTQFTAVPTISIATASPADLTLSISDLIHLRFIIIVIVALTGGTALGAAALNVRDVCGATAARDAALSPLCGCTQLPDGLWLWRLTQEPLEDDVADEVRGSAVEVSGLLGFPFVRLATALPESWLGTTPAAATGRACGLSASGFEAQYEALHDALANGRRDADELEKEASLSYAIHTLLAADISARSEASLPDEFWRGAAAPDMCELSSTAFMHAAMLAYSIECTATIDEQREMYFARMRALGAPHLCAEFSRLFGVFKELLCPGVLSAGRNWWHMARLARTVLLANSAGYWDADGGIATALLASSHVPPPPQLGGIRRLVSAARLGASALVSVLTGDAADFVAQADVDQPENGDDGDKDGLEDCPLSFSAAAIGTSIPLYLYDTMDDGESDKEAMPLRVWTTMLVAALLESLSFGSWRVAERADDDSDVTLLEHAERWLDGALHGQPVALRLKLRASATAQLAAWVARHEAAVIATRAAMAHTELHREALKRRAGGAALTAALVKHGTVRLFVAGQVFGGKRHQHLLVLAASLMGALAVGIWLY
jgi:hypothetical protein